MDYATCLSATWRRTTTAKRDDFHSKSLFLVKKIKDNGTQKAVQRQRMGILLCEQNFRDVWRRNKSVRAEIGKILRTHTRGSISSKDNPLIYIYIEFSGITGNPAQGYNWYFLFLYLFSHLTQLFVLFMTSVILLW